MKVINFKLIAYDKKFINVYLLLFLSKMVTTKDRRRAYESGNTKANITYY